MNQTRFRLAVVAMLVCAGLRCAHLTEMDKAREQAKRSGKYKVRLTEDAESVQGTCKFVRTIVPDFDPVIAPTKGQLDDYYRTEGVLLGADTVLVDGRTGEAYLCGKTPLNPDGTPRDGYNHVTPSATPPK
ncbi:MAG: hypothetical protein ABI968_13055 [Acidobacteriota bacterium]